MNNILVLNGPNLNLLGKREPVIYGHETLADVENICRKAASNHDFDIDFRQSNMEGELIEWIQTAGLEKGKYAGILINAAGYTHTSIAIHDALKFTGLPIAEVHLSDLKSRESFRHISYVEPLADVIVTGEGAKGYGIALEKLIAFL